MEYIPPALKSGSSSVIAETLFRLHSIQNNVFGLHFNNYIGQLPQCNNTDTDWPNFWYTNRIKPLTDRACQLNLLIKDDLPDPQHYINALTKLQKYLL